MADNNFNELLIHTLKQIHIRLDRHEAKFDCLDAKFDEKANRKWDSNINGCLDRIDRHLDRIELELKRFPWIISAKFVCFGVFVIFLEAC